MSFVALPFVRMKGVTPGVASGEIVELTPHWPPTGAFVNQAGVLEIRVVATGLISGNTVSRSFVQRFSIYRDGSGVTHLGGSNTQRAWGDAAGSSWTLTVSVLSGPDRLGVVFTTGSTTVQAQIVADIYYTVTAPPAAVPTPIVEWRSDYGLTVTGVNSPPSTWYSRQPQDTFILNSTSSHILQTPGWQNGLPGFGYTSDFDNGTPPDYNPPTQIYPSNLPSPPDQDLPLTGTDLTVYMVLDYQNPGTVGPFPIFRIGVQNDDSNYNPQFQILINNSGGPSNNVSDFTIYDEDPSFSNVGRYFTNFTYKNSVNPSFGPSLLVAQTQRNSSHNCVFQGQTLSAWSSQTSGTTIPDFQSLAYNRQVVEIAGKSYVLSGVNFAWEACTRIGHVLIYNAYHSPSTIQAVAASLNAFWGL